eukprot:1346702-Pleurochrysis_carterae.AAC.2
MSINLVEVRGRVGVAARDADPRTVYALTHAYTHARACLRMLAHAYARTHACTHAHACVHATRRRHSF